MNKIAFTEDWCRSAAQAEEQGGAQFTAGASAALAPLWPVENIASDVCQAVAELGDRNSPEGQPDKMLVTHEELFLIVQEALTAALPCGLTVLSSSFQARLQPWLQACFGEQIAGDREERNHRFLEEAIELVQACGCTASEAHQLVDYVFGRPVGEPAQEVGGVMVTLAALCLANSMDMHHAAETELARIWTMVEAISAKQAAKPKHSPLPGPSATAPAQPAEPTGRIDCRQCNGAGLVRGHLDDCFSALCTLNGDVHSCPGEVKPCACTKPPLNGIRATMFHDEGAIAQCGYCKRYTLDRAALSDRQPECTCGERHGWSGGFVKPGPDAQWHGPAPTHRPQPSPSNHEYASRYQWLRERPLDAVHKGGVFAGKTPDNLVLNGADLDAAIDAARALEARQK